MIKISLFIILVAFSFGRCQPNALFDQNNSAQKNTDSLIFSTKATPSSVHNSSEATNSNETSNPGLFSSDNSSDTFMEKAQKKWRELLKEPYVHSVVLPAMVGVVFAICTMAIVCCIRSCVRSHVRKKRKMRIRNLADELKTDRSMLLADSSDDEF